MSGYANEWWVSLCYKWHKLMVLYQLLPGTVCDMPNYMRCHARCHRHPQYCQSMSYKWLNIGDTILNIALDLYISDRYITWQIYNIRPCWVCALNDHSYWSCHEDVRGKVSFLALCVISYFLYGTIGGYIFYKIWCYLGFDWTWKTLITGDNEWSVNAIHTFCINVLIIINHCNTQLYGYFCKPLAWFL